MMEFPEQHGMQDIESRSADRIELTGPARRGSICPNCGKGKLDYNGLLELECPVCGYRDTGGAGYT